jgi:hypothetical protein
MLLKCYHYLHPTIEFEIECANQTIDVDSNLNIFKQIPNTSESMKELSQNKPLI